MAGLHLEGVAIVARPIEGPAAELALEVVEAVAARYDARVRTSLFEALLEPGAQSAGTTGRR